MRKTFESNGCSSLSYKKQQSEMRLIIWKDTINGKRKDFQEQLRELEVVLIN